MNAVLELKEMNTVLELKEMNPVLELKKITKSFVGNTVLSEINLSIEPGKVHAVIGENGAGKSTLMNVIGGIHQPDSGDIVLDNKKVTLDNPIQAMNNGISIVHQELSLVPNLSVAQNIFSNYQVGTIAPRRKVDKLGFIKWRSLYADAADLLERVGLNIEPTTMVSQLTISVQQLVEIAKAVSFNAKVLILDEPTSALSEKETERLFSVIRELTEQGVAIIFISHKLTEVFAIADQISVLRDGKLVNTGSASEFTRGDVIRMMVGRQIEDIYPDNQGQTGKEILRVESLSREGHFEEVSFTLHKGEILGFAGLVGSGRTEVARAIFGADKLDTGHVTMYGKKVTINSPTQAIENGICYLTEDRKNLGLFLQMPVRDNIVSSSLKFFGSKLGFAKQKLIEAESQRYVDYLDIRPKNDLNTMINLSGGNQQKALLAKWISSKPKVLIADEPTRGVDIGAKVQIHRHLRTMADEGTGVIVISSELPEVLGLSDRIVVFRHGRIAAILDGNDVTQEKAMKYATT